MRVSRNFRSSLFVVPPNTTAAIHVPGKNVTESGGLKIQRAGRDETVFEAGSGTYSFVAR